MNNRLRKLQIISFVSALFMPASFLIAPINSLNTVQSPRWVAVLAGSVFWAFLVLEILSQVFITKERKKWFRLKRITDDPISKVGVLSFFSNPAAKVADIICIVSLILCILFLLFVKNTNYFHFILIFIFVSSFCFHCIFNGKNIVFVYNRKAFLKSNETDQTSQLN